MTKKSVGLESLGMQRVGYDLETEHKSNSNGNKKALYIGSKTRLYIFVGQKWNTEENSEHSCDVRLVGLRW